jgi:hypothetical protein
MYVWGMIVNFASGKLLPSERRNDMANDEKYVPGHKKS